MKQLYRDPDKGYRSNWLWLPKKHINVWAARSKCSVYTPDGKTIQAYREIGHHIIVPRELSFPEPWKFPIINYNQPTEEFINWGCTADDRSKEDVEIWNTISDANSGIMHLACGKGKTVFGLRKIAYENGPGLIVVSNSQLAGQWKERVQQFLTIGDRPVQDHEIGLVQGTKEQWDKPIVIAMIQSMVRRDIPVDIQRRFKTVVFDEAHHLAAPKWLKAASFGMGVRLGLTATPDNESGTHHLYYHHLGKILCVSLAQPLIPSCFFVQIPGKVSLQDPDIVDINGMFNIPKMYTKLGTIDSRNGYIKREISNAEAQGRKILVLTHSEAHCWLLHGSFPDSGICVGDVSFEDRLHFLKTRRIIFGTVQLAKEGLDQPDLDTVMLLTPFKNKNMLQQILGRIQRFGGKPPIAVFFEDSDIKPCVSLCIWLRKHLQQWQYPIQIVRRN